ncbi:HWE histidine kinase domain-containing protein [Pseudoroseomonas wenyumeiae]
MPDASTLLPDSSPGEAFDLTNCDREPIHLLGAIQPIGFLIATSPDWRIQRVSANVAQYLGRPPEALLGTLLPDLFTREVLHEIGGRLHLLRGPSALERLFGLPLREGGAPFDLAVHMAGEQIVIEAEPSDLEDALEAATTVRSMITRLQQAEGFEALCKEAVRQIRGLTGFSRVMLYRFHHDGTGEVIAESAASFVDSFMGLRFPASDIPKQARLLYERNWLRLIGDTGAEPVAILPQRDARGQPLDLSLSVLRSVSPTHVEYLRNMGVAASMSISVLRKGKLWGLIACHHTEPLRVPFERRTAAGSSPRCSPCNWKARSGKGPGAEAVANKMHNRLMASLGAMRPGSRSLADFLEMLAEVLPCDGVGLWSAHGTALRGSTPGTEDFAALVRFLNRAASGTIYATHRLGEVFEPARAFADRAAGLLAIPLSRGPRDYLVFFRRQVSHAVTWAGDPNKPVTTGSDGIRIAPRKSFAAWREMVEGHSTPWTETDMQTAERLRVTLLEVVLQLSDLAERERRVAQERQEILIAELNHRVRNILGLIRGLVKQSQGNASSVEDFATMIGGRIQALARAHDQITADKWQPAPLADLVLAEAAAYLEHRADRVILSGPPVLLEPNAHTTMALVIHEMMTNAVKYGALCDRHGTVRIGWRRLEGGDLEILWNEEGGPPVQAPSRKGFGTTIIERAVPHDLGGEAELRYALGGLQARFVLPAAQVHDDAAPRQDELRPAPRPAEEEAGPLGRRVMLVEDNLLIAMDAEDQLRRLGATEVDVASSVQAALQIIARTPPDVALLDMNLGRETSFPVADALSARGIPFVFATGYGEASAFPERFQRSAVVKKPYTQADIRAALLGCLG